METSILNSTKKVLGIAEDYTAFDEDIIMHINTAFATLTQLGIGPSSGFMIQDESAVWADFLGVTVDEQFNAVKSYIYLCVRLLFDPPTTSYVIEAYERQLREMEWRLNTHREELDWVPPVEEFLDEETDIPEVIDGGVI